jgi:hypothetical protein
LLPFRGPRLQLPQFAHTLRGAEFHRHHFLCLPQNRIEFRNGDAHRLNRLGDRTRRI